MDQAKWVAWSLGIWGAVVTALTAALPAFNAMLVFFFGVDWSIEPAWIAALDENVKMVITGVGGIIGVVMMFWGRWRAKAPLTLLPPSWKGGA